jgi:hypothetical protein
LQQSSCCRSRSQARSSRGNAANSYASLSLNGCGRGPAQAPPSNLLYTPAGTYQWRVAASSTTGPAISSSLVLTVTVQ